MRIEKERQLPLRILLVLAAFYAQSFALKCYVGSKGSTQNGNEVLSFLPNECEEEMTHCFESHSDDLSQITASCQSPNTEQRLLDVCKQGCRTHNALNITICCCDSDLCNLPKAIKNNMTEGNVEGEVTTTTTEKNEFSLVDLEKKTLLNETKPDEVDYSNSSELPRAH
ncbi:unnamed protein product [Cylicocyclus nassatus]|uniref:Uncharacterized protein n=1 Tax=Cylicocyclus nassatus TaxID=53992 RepID=A0AA36M8B9_CYLNA|nr:unnamed protein product [Cylicocyclus nassatus]